MQAKELSKKLMNINLMEVMGACKDTLPRTYKVRDSQKNDITTEDVVLLYRFVELLSLTLGIPYETESLFLIADLRVLQRYLSEIHKSIEFLSKLGDKELDVPERDNDIFREYALYSLEHEVIEQE